LSKAAVVKGHVSDMELSNNSDSEENDMTNEFREVDHEYDQVEVQEEVAIHETLKLARKRNKRSLQSKSNDASETN